MGPLLIFVRRAALGSVVLISLGGAACQSGCREKTTYLALPAPYAGYFSRLPTFSTGPDGRVVPARSSTGLTDSYVNVYVTEGGYFPQPEGKNCEM
jgi:hypothetical protein